VRWACCDDVDEDVDDVEVEEVNVVNGDVNVNIVSAKVVDPVSSWSCNSKKLWFYNNFNFLYSELETDEINKRNFYIFT